MKWSIDRASVRGAPYLLSPEGAFYALVLASLLVFVLWPVAAVFAKSVIIDGKLDFSEYVYLFTEDFALLYNSVSVSLLTTLLSLLIGTAVALYLTHTSLPGKRIVFSVLLLSIIAPPFVSSLVYVMLLGRRGLITYKLLGLDINPYGWHGVVLMQTAGFTALAALLILGVLHRVDRTMEYSAHDLGASSLSTLCTITLPLAMPGLLVAAVVVFIRSLSDFGTPIIIGGRFTVLATEAYLNVVGLYNMPRAAAMGIMLLLPALGAFLLYRRTIGRASVFSSNLLPGHNQDRIAMAPWLQWLLALCTWGYVAFEIVKYGTVLSGAVARTWGFDFTPTFKHFESLSADKLESLFRSFRYSFLAATAGAILGGVIAYIFERKRLLGAKAFDFIADLPYIIPGPFFGIAYILAFHNPPLVLTGTAFIVVANCVYRQLPISIKSCVAVLKQCRPEIEAGARDLGAKERHVLKDIVAPLMTPAILIAFVNTFTMTMVTIGGIIFLVSPHTKVATVVMFSEINRGRIGEASVLASIIIVTVLAINLLFSWIYLKKGK